MDREPLGHKFEDSADSALPDQALSPSPFLSLSLSLSLFKFLRSRLAEATGELSLAEEVIDVARLALVTSVFEP